MKKKKNKTRTTVSISESALATVSGTKVKTISKRKVSKWGSTSTTTLVYFHPWPKKSFWERIIDRLFFWLR